MRAAQVIALAIALVGCGEELPLTRTTTVVQMLALAREQPEGVSVGFNLDAQVSTTLDSHTCNQSDFVDPAGKVGIDNQIAKLMPLIDIAGQGAVDALLQAAIGEGRLLMFAHVDSTEGSDQVEIVFERGSGVPLVGGDGLLLAGQTIARHSDPELGRAIGTRGADGVIMSEAFTLRLPVIVFNLFFDLQLPEAHIRMVPTEDGGYDAVLGGWAPVETFLEITRKADERGNQFERLFGQSIREYGDLQIDRSSGTCQALSLAATFRSVPAFQF